MNTLIDIYKAMDVNAIHCIYIHYTFTHIHTLYIYSYTNILPFSTEAVLNILVTGEWIIDNNSTNNRSSNISQTQPSSSYTNSTANVGNMSDNGASDINGSSSNGYIIPVSSYRSAFIHMAVRILVYSVVYYVVLFRLLWYVVVYCITL